MTGTGGFGKEGRKRKDRKKEKERKNERKRKKERKTGTFELHHHPCVEVLLHVGTGH